MCQQSEMDTMHFPSGLQPPLNTPRLCLAITTDCDSCWLQAHAQTVACVANVCHRLTDAVTDKRQSCACHVFLQTPMMRNVSRETFVCEWDGATDQQSQEPMPPHRVALFLTDICLHSCVKGQSKSSKVNNKQRKLTSSNDDAGPYPGGYAALLTSPTPSHRLLDACTTHAHP